jgi:SAM-dependent methyltransferase
MPSHLTLRRVIAVICAAAVWAGLYTWTASQHHLILADDRKAATDSGIADELSKCPFSVPEVCFASSASASFANDMCDELMKKNHSVVAPMFSRSLRAGARGEWSLPSGYQYSLDELLADAISLILQSDRVLELGAGIGRYADYIQQTGRVGAVTAFDGVADIVSRTNGRVQHANLAEPHDFGSFDWVMSLEVGEHIPAEFAEVFLDNITKHAKKGVLLSWAVPNQIGTGHVNNQPNEVVIDWMRSSGFHYDECAALFLRASATLGWFRNTIMVFRRVV